MVVSKFGSLKQKLNYQYLIQVFAILSFVFILVWPSIGSATTLQKLDIDQVAKGAIFIFEGEVLTHEVRNESNTGLISTYVTFLVLDVIKGDSETKTIELKFAGGTFNGETTKIHGLTVPEPGEQGVYFVESTSENLVNPLVGWSQGHFIIKEIDGKRVIYTNEHNPVVDVQSVSSIPPLIKRPNAILEEISSTAAGVLIDDGGEMRRQGLQINKLKSEILEMIR